MTSIVETLDANQIKQAQAQANAIATAPTSKVSSSQFVFFAAFDGTENGDDPNLDGSGDTQTTAVQELATQVKNASSASVQVGYFPGVGTPGTDLGSAFEPNAVTDQSIQNAQDAYKAFAIAATTWLAANPGGSLTSMITSFSRGGAAAAIFAQMLYEKGLVNAAGTVLIPPGTTGVISAALIIDPVLTGDTTVTGNPVSANLDFPPGVKNLTIVQAQNEYRDEFPAATYTGDGATVLPVMGNHGDAGDLYDNGLGGIYLGGYTSFFQNAGLNIAGVPASRTYDSTKPVVIHSEVAFNPPYDASTYNPSSNPSVTRATDSYGTPVTLTGSATSFRAYNGDFVLGGTGGSSTAGGYVNTSGPNVVQGFALLPSAQATITSFGDNITVGDKASLTFNSTAEIGNTNAVQNGSASTVTLGIGSTLALNGWNTTVTANNDVITVGANANDTTINGSGNTITEGTGAKITVTAPNDNIILNTNATALEAVGYEFNEGVTYDTANGDAVTFAAGTTAPASQYSDTGTVSMALNAPDGDALGTLAFNTATNADSFTLTDGLSFALPGVGKDTIAALGTTVTPYAALKDYLADLGYTGNVASLDSAYLNPTGSSYTVTGSVTGFAPESGGKTYAVVGYTPGAAGASMTGQNTAVYNGTTYDAYNYIFVPSGGNTDLTNDNWSNMQALTLGTTAGATAELTGAQFAGFSNLTGAGTLILTTAGSYSLNGDAADNGFFSLAAQSWGGTTLTGSATNYQALTASLYGNDTLNAGSGTDDVLVAGEGVDTITAGSGGDIIYALSGLAAGSRVTGNLATPDAFVASGDISGASIVNQRYITLGNGTATSVGMTAAQLAGFTGGIYLGAATLTGDDTASTTGYVSTLITSGSGNDTLTTGGDAGDSLSATGAGNDSLAAGNGAGDRIAAANDNSAMPLRRGA